MPTDKKPKTRSLLIIYRDGASKPGVHSLLIESPMTSRQLEDFVARLCYILRLDPEVALKVVFGDEVFVSGSRTIPLLTIGVKAKTFTRMMQVIDPEYRKALDILGLF